MGQICPMVSSIWLGRDSDLPVGCSRGENLKIMNLSISRSKHFVSEQPQRCLYLRRDYHVKSCINFGMSIIATTMYQKFTYNCIVRRMGCSFFMFVLVPLHDIIVEQTPQLR